MTGAAALVDSLRGRGLSLAVAESCTGGMLGAELTAVPGSSEVFLGGVISYADDLKRELLGVRDATLASCGAVSERAVAEMAVGVRKVAGADVGIAVTGIAGPGGGTSEKPVGTVWICVAVGEELGAEMHRFGGERDEVRRASVDAAVTSALRALPQTTG